ncbi:hypothetical protein EVAR_76407_1 [Eumeta japonica]|uniref:Uncharacterized protein n=1 Tax=Eumeta variegata TaxID=151549 RepID=A0A4C1T7U8_EUMVA|nr:hypothetical protein EVAR_76407_1 [Eumeta japonica]
MKGILDRRCLKIVIASQTTVDSGAPARAGPSEGLLLQAPQSKIKISVGGYASAVGIRALSGVTLPKGVEGAVEEARGEGRGARSDALYVKRDMIKQTYTTYSITPRHNLALHDMSKRSSRRR